MIQQLIQWDQALFEAINGWHVPWADIVMYWVSEKTFWIPFYALLLLFIYRKVGLKQTLFVLLAVAILITLTDRITSGLIKPWVARFRPCRLEAGLEMAVHIVRDHCGGKYGFVSSHAANFFGLATFMALFFSRKGLSVLFLGIAALVGYSRIYLGVHYPGDVLGGALIGVICGLLVMWGYRTLIGNHRVHGGGTETQRA